MPFTKTSTTAALLKGSSPGEMVLGVVALSGMPLNSCPASGSKAPLSQWSAFLQLSTPSTNRPPASRTAKAKANGAVFLARGRSPCRSLGYVTGQPTTEGMRSSQGPTKKERGGNQKPETKHPNTPKGGPQQGQPNNLGQLNPPAASSPFHLSSPPRSAKVFKAARKEEASACNSKDHKIQVNPKLQRSEPRNWSSLHSSAREGGKKHGRFALLRKLHESSEMRLRVENGIIW